MENFSKNESIPKKSSLLKSLLISTLISLPEITSGQVKIPPPDKNVIEQNDDSFKIPNLKSLDATDRVFAIDENNDTYINPWVIITPLQLEIGTETKNFNKTLIRIPYKYSRSFNTAEAQSEEEKNKVAIYIEEMLKKEFAEKLVFWDYNNLIKTKDVYDYHHEGEITDLSKVKINNIKITGLSSPEGPEEKNKKTLAIGNIDKENIVLSKKRAEDMDPEIKLALKALGLETETISEIKSKEVQFNEKELAILDSLAKSVGIDNTVDELESAFILIKEYNAGKIKDPDVISKLDSIVGTKRMVEIEITYDEDKKEKHVVPIPLTLLLLIPGIRSLRRLSGEKIRERFKRTTTEDPELLKEKNNSVNYNSKIFRNLYELASNSTEAKQYKEHILERLMVDEFNPYFGTKKDDVDYFQYMMLAVNVNNANLETVERAIAFNLLEKWELNDNMVRIYKTKEIITNELHYWQEPQKILWAREAAQQLIRYAQIYEQAKKIPFPEIAVYQEISNDMKILRSKNNIAPERKKIRTTRIPSSQTLLDKFMNLGKHPIKRKKD